MTLTIPTKADIVAGCDDGATIARLRLAGVPFLLWYAAFEDDPACLALRGFRFGTYADDARDSAAEKLQWSRFTVADACAAVAEKRGTYIQGYNRIGKSHLAAAQVRASDTDCFWINEADFAEFVYASKSAESTAPTITDLIRYLTTPVHHGWRRGKIARVIYDDACARMDYGGKGVYWLGELFLLIEALMKNDIALTVTSNADADTLIAEPAEGGLGPRVGSRMLEMTGDPLLLFAPEKKSQSGPPPAKKIDRCTCLTHYPAVAPSDAPVEYIELQRASGPVQYVPARWDHFLPDVPPPPFDLNEKDMTPKELRGKKPEEVADAARAKLAAMMAGLRAAPIMQPVRGDEPDTEIDRATLSGDGSFCHRETPCTDADRADAAWYGVHASRWHRPAPPKASEPVTPPAAQEATA